VKGIVPTTHQNVLAKCTVLLSERFIGTRNDLLKLTCSPVESKKDLNKPFKLKRVLPSAGKMSSVSSAYWTIGKSPPKVSLTRCFRIPFLQALFTIDCSRSTARTKRSGDRGSPCHTPLLRRKGLPSIPLRRTENSPDHRMILIQFTHFSGNPLCLRTWRMTSCSTLSNAFSKSSLRMTISFFEWWHMCRNWKAQAKQS